MESLKVDSDKLGASTSFGVKKDALPAPDKIRSFKPLSVPWMLGLAALLLGASASVIFQPLNLKRELNPVSVSPTLVASVSATPLVQMSLTPVQNKLTSSKTPSVPPIISATTTPKPIPTTDTVLAITQAALQKGILILHVVLGNGDPAHLTHMNLTYPDQTVRQRDPDYSGYLRLPDLLAGSYSMLVQYSTNSYQKSFTIQKGETTDITVTVVPPPAPTPTPSPSPAPDTQAPVLTGFSGPYEQSDGTCVILYANQIHDNQQSNNFCVNWSMDGQWTGWYTNLAYKCYTDLSPGSHTVSAKVKDEAGNVSNEVSVTFTK